MISGTVVGDKEIAKRFRALPDGVRSKVIDKVQALVIRLQRMVRQEKLSGQVLNVRSGTLRRSIDQRMITDNTAVSGVVSTNVKYGRPHEYGSNETVTVKEHVRLVKQAFGRALKSPVWATVKTHTAKQNIPEKSFLRSALADMKPEILDELEKAAGEGIKK